MDDAALTPQKQAFVAAIQLAGSEEKLADIIGCTQPAINKAKLRDTPIAPEWALSIDARFAPVVTKSHLRPDLWPDKKAAPKQEAAEVH